MNNFIQFRFYYALSLHEYGRWLTRRQSGADTENPSKELESVRSKYESVLRDWEAIGNRTKDFDITLWAYYRLFPDLERDPDERERMRELEERFENQPLEQGSPFLMVSAPIPSHSLRVAEWCRQRLKANGAEIQTRWMLSRLEGLEESDEFFQTVEFTDHERLRILAITESYSTAFLDQFLEPEF